MNKTIQREFTEKEKREMIEKVINNDKYIFMTCNRETTEGGVRGSRVDILMMLTYMIKGFLESGIEKKEILKCVDLAEKDDDKLKDDFLEKLDELLNKIADKLEK